MSYSYPPMQILPMNGTSPQNAAYNNFIQSQQATAKLSLLAGGKEKRLRKKRRGGQSAITSQTSSVASQASTIVPRAPVLYKDISVPSLNGPGGIMEQLVSTINQNAANSVYDKYASVGGYRRRSRKRKTTNKVRKIKKSRKYRK